MLTFVYLLFGVEYAAALGSGYELLLGVLTGVLFTNGIAELIIAVIVVTAICCPILRMAEKKSK